MIDYHSRVLPQGAIPLAEAIRRFVPDNLWRQFERAEEAEVRARVYYFMSFTLKIRVQDAIKDAQDAIERALVGRLIAHDLIALAQAEAPFGEWRLIPADTWRRLRIKHVRGSAVIFHEIELTDVHVMVGDNTQGLELMRTGASGRPTSKHLVFNELDRLIAAGEIARLNNSGEVEKTPKAMAEDLVFWLKQTHPTAPSMTQTTMENAIRLKFNKFKKDLKEARYDHAEVTTLCISSQGGSSPRVTSPDSSDHA